jgi:hypothetical protein
VAYPPDVPHRPLALAHPRLAADDADVAGRDDVLELGHDGRPWPAVDKRHVAEPWEASLVRRIQVLESACCVPSDGEAKGGR